MFHSTLYTLGTGILGGITFASVAVTAGELLSTPPNMYIVIGIASIAALGAAIALAVKKWLESQITKLVELPTKQEIFAAITSSVSQATNYHSSLLEEVAKISGEVRAMHADFQAQFHLLDNRVTTLESRHETEDRLSSNGYKQPISFTK